MYIATHPSAIPCRALVVRMTVPVEIMYDTINVVPYSHFGFIYFEYIIYKQKIIIILLVYNRKQWSRGGEELSLKL